MTSTAEKIRDHLTQQKAQAVGEYRACCYRGDNGTMCAVGCLIDDATYSPNMEGQTVHGLVSKDVAEREAFKAWTLPADITLIELRCWQQYHDDACDLADGIYCYEAWCGTGSEADSPEAFYQAWCKEFGHEAS